MDARGRHHPPRRSRGARGPGAPRSGGGAGGGDRRRARVRRELRGHDGPGGAVRAGAQAARGGRLRGRGDDRGGGGGRLAARVGERVLAGTRFGGYAARVVVRSDDALALPESLSFAAGAADPGQLRDGMGGLLATHAAAGRAGAHPRRRGRGGDRGDAARTRARRLRRGHRVGGQARRPARAASTRPSTTGGRGGGATSRRSIWCSTRSAGGRCGAPTRCCARAGGSSPTAPRRCCRARSATCGARHRRRWPCCAASTSSGR